MRMKIRRNILLFKLYCLMGDLWPLSALAVVYFQQITGSYASAMGVFAIMGIIQSFAEVPTGIISDRIGRRKTMVMSALLTLVAFILFAVAGTWDTEYLLFVAGTIWAIGDAFASGTDDALMYETMEQLRKADKYDIIYARSKTFGQIGLALGALIAVAITYFWSLTVLAWVSAALCVLPLIITTMFVEPDIHTWESNTTLRHFTDAIKGLITNAKLRTLAIIQTLSHGVGFAGHRLEGAYFNTLVPAWAVNVARIIKQACGAASFAIAPYFRRFGFYRILIASTLGMTVIKSVALVLNNIATPFIQSCVNIFYGTASTADSALLQKELSAKQRATMGSMVALLGGLMSAAIYWMIGIIADVTSIYCAIIALVMFNLIISGGYYWMLKKYK